MPFFAHVPPLAHAAVLGLASVWAPDLARLAFGTLLWVVLVILNRGAAGASPRPSALEVGAVPSPRRRLEPSEAVRDGRRRAPGGRRAAPATTRAGVRAAR